jgi:lipase/lipase (class 2)
MLRRIPGWAFEERTQMGIRRLLTVILSILSIEAAACGKDSKTTTPPKKESDAGTDNGSGGKSSSSGGKGGGSSAGKGGNGGSGSTSTFKPTVPGDDCKVVVKDADCDKSQRPFVFVHGTYGSGDNIANVAMLFGSNGYCQDRFVAIEYNSIDFTGMDNKPESNGKLDALIDQVLKDTGFDQVDLAGHSQGTGHCVAYLADPAHAKKVAHYINYSGAGMVPNNVPTLSLSSENDLGGSPHHAPNADKMVTFKDEDHFGVAASQNAFVETWKYLHDGKDPEYKEIQCGEDPITLEGIAESFADNTVITGSKLEVYEVNPDATSPRDEGKIVMTVMPDEKTGHIGPLSLKRLVQYDFKAIDADGTTLGHVFFSPFKRSNRLARFLSPSKTAVVAAATTDQVTRDAGFTAFVARNLPGAFRHDLGDVLKLDGNDVLTDDNAGRTLITVGLFMSDQNKNGTSDLGAVFMQSFIIGTDVFVDASKPAWVEIEWQGKLRMKIPNYPSSTDGLMSLMFQ